MDIQKQTVENNIIKVILGEDADDSATNDSASLDGKVELDIENQSYFVDVVNALFDEGKFNIIVDLKDVSYIDSSGLWALFEGHKRAAQKEGEMVLLNPSSDVSRVLNITKMSSKMKVFSEELEAIKNFS